MDKHEWRGKEVEDKYPDNFLKHYSYFAILILIIFIGVVINEFYKIFSKFFN